MRLTFLVDQLDSWLPERFEDNPRFKAETRIRARALLGLYIASFLIIGFSLLAFLGLQLFGHHHFPMAFISLAVIGGLTGIQVLMFYRVANIGASAIIFSMVFFGSTLVLMVITGGWNSPVRQLFFCAPMISFLIGGRQEGLYTSALVLVIGLVNLFAIDLDIKFFESIMLAENAELASAVVWFVSLNVLVSCFLVYDNILNAYCKSGAAEARKRPALR